MQMVFEANTADFAKRKRVARACATCQRRKKRCKHVFGDQEQPEDPQVPVLAHKDPVRFVGDLNPEGVLRDLSSRAKGDPRDCEVGVFVDPTLQAERNVFQLTTSSKNSNGPKSSVAIDRHGKIDRGFRTLSGAEKTYLQSVGAFRKLPKTTEDALITTYFSCVDIIVPLLDGVKFLHDYAAVPRRVSPFLILAMCLITCKTEEAYDHLKLTEHGQRLDPITFARTLYIGLDAAMKLDLEADRLTKIQILAMMSLHNDSPSGLEDSSYHLSHAIHDANTSGLHIQTTGRRANDQPSYVWWCLWVFDKINSCISGRSIMISDRDIGIPRPPLHDPPKTHGLLIWLALADVLVKIIDLYRPTSDHSCSGWEEDFPSFASLISPYKYGDLQPSEQKILEVFYNVIAILSCRSASPSHPSYIRRLHAGNEIQRLMANGYFEHIPPLPLVPYAVSLSLTVAYRVIRERDFSSSDPDAITARANLATRCELLESLSPRYWPADAMAKLGRKALLSLGKPGSTKASTLHLVRQLKNEVVMCKDQNADTRGTQPEDVPLSNALHVLSSAAAAHGEHASNVNENADGMSMIATSTEKPVEMTSAHSFYTPTLTNGSANTNTNTNENTKYTPESFQNLDTLFDDFFDLSMPTFFEDPLFDGAAFGFDFESLPSLGIDGVGTGN